MADSGGVVRPARNALSFLAGSSYLTGKQKHQLWLELVSQMQETMRFNMETLEATDADMKVYIGGEEGGKYRVVVFDLVNGQIYRGDIKPRPVYPFDVNAALKSGDLRTLGGPSDPN